MAIGDSLPKSGPINGPTDQTTSDLAAEEAATALRSSERRFRLLVESVQDYSLILLDPEGRIASWNAGAEHLLGYEEAEILGEHFSCIFTPEEIQQGLPQRELQKARQEGRAENDHWHVRKDGTQFWGSGVTTPVWDGTLLGYVSVVRDLTDQKEAQTALQESEERHRKLAVELEEMNRQKERFLAMLSHELRNPLAPIFTALDVMRQDQTENPSQQETRCVIERQVRQLTRIVDDLLQTSRLAAGKLQLRKQPVELRAVIGATTEAVQPFIAEHKHELSVSFPAKPIWLDADATRLQQIFLNLVHNAAKYTPDGGQIQLVVERFGDEVVVSVRDTGVGIPAQMLDRVFEMFTQVEPSLDSSQGGLGIGLTLVKHLTELHGGSVAIHSDGVGRGSKFAVRLPVRAESDQQPQPATDAGGSAAAASLRVLVVDDKKDATTMMRKLLTQWGHEVGVAHGGREALDLAADFCPEVVLMDLGMPGMNGYEAARRMREQPWCANAVLIALTGWGQDEDRERTREAGFDDHFVKPVEMSVLRKLLDDIK